eukprot:TRINITY_DN429_c0_g1_i1.p1 TRINITY_DN429_c0_g1~~TRINITY_DN429_c0_g1_i1.p1  ORF type:complete len:91 (-),score=22.21 TRINITY_DN429_c0_g1_i1:35-307(-)
MCMNTTACHLITVEGTNLENITHTNWNCRFVASYKVDNNIPTGLETCMAKSMNKSEIAAYHPCNGVADVETRKMCRLYYEKEEMYWNANK